MVKFSTSKIIRIFRNCFTIQECTDLGAHYFIIDIVISHYRGSSHFMISQFMILANSWFFSGINFMNSSQIHDFETKNSKKKNSDFFFRNCSDWKFLLQKIFRPFFFRFVSYFFVVQVKVMNCRRRLEISASKDSNLWFSCRTRIIKPRPFLTLFWLFVATT